MSAKFELYKGREGDFRWRLVSRKGEIITSSEGYTTKADAIKGIESFKLGAGEFIRLSVSDTGTGMNRDTLQHIVDAPITDLAKEIRENTKALKDSISWPWRLLATVVAIATVLMVIFQILSYVAIVKQ